MKANTPVGVRRRKVVTPGSTRGPEAQQHGARIPPRVQDVSTWIDILKQEVSAKGPKQVAVELGVSRATVDLLSQDKYTASPANMIEKLKAIYGANGQIACPVLGEISPLKCAETWKKAKSIGLRVGNPETARLHVACMNCTVRSADSSARVRR